MLLDPLENDIAERLAAAGDRARSSNRVVPDREFSADLRDRLMTAAGDREALPDRARDRESPAWVAWSLPSFFRMPRLLPVAVASLLLIAGVVAARELYVAIGNRPDATPVPSVDLLVPSESVAAPVVSASGEPNVVESAAAIPAHTPAPTARPTAKPTAKPTAVPTAVPTADPTPPLLPMSLTATGCDGGVVLEWSQYGGGSFDHYTTLRNTTNSIPKAYPPQGGAVDPGGTYTPNAGKTSAFDTGVSAGTTYYYRTMAFDADDGVIGASSVVSAVPAMVASLGSLSVVADVVDPADTVLTWTPYAGPANCFTWYKLVYSQTSSSPSYLDGDSYIAISSQGTGYYKAVAGELPPGNTYFRVQVIRFTDLGPFLVAETDVQPYLVP